MTEVLNKWAREAEALVRDARRYRWLRQNSSFLGWEPDYLPEFVDRAVDREMAADPRATDHPAEGQEP